MADTPTPTPPPSWFQRLSPEVRHLLQLALSVGLAVLFARLGVPQPPPVLPTTPQPQPPFVLVVGNATTPGPVPVAIANK